MQNAPGIIEGCFEIPGGRLSFCLPSVILPSQHCKHTSTGRYCVLLPGSQKGVSYNTPCTGKGSCLVPIIHNASPGQGKPALARLIIFKKINNRYAVRPG